MIIIIVILKSKHCCHCLLDSFAMLGIFYVIRLVNGTVGFVILCS